MERTNILLVEDNAGDVFLTRRALEECHVDASLRVARDGEEALQMLADPAFHPELIILDLNMPRVTGYAVLEQCAGSDVPVVIFSSSSNELDVQRTMMLGAREYVRKPISLKAFTQAIQGIAKRWLTHSTQLVCSV